MRRRRQSAWQQRSSLWFDKSLKILKHLLPAWSLWEATLNTIVLLQCELYRLRSQRRIQQSIGRGYFAFLQTTNLSDSNDCVRSIILRSLPYWPAWRTLIALKNLVNVKSVLGSGWSVSLWRGNWRRHCECLRISNGNLVMRRNQT